jgi:hypothetical protein
MAAPERGAEAPSQLVAPRSVWRRPQRFGYAEQLRGLGGIVAPLLAGFSLAGIATLVSADRPPPLADWATAALATAVALLLYAMQVAIAGLTLGTTPADILTWHPEAAVSEQELELARRAQAKDFEDMAKMYVKFVRIYPAGLVAFLLGVMLLMIPEDWSVGWVVGLAVTFVALSLEISWVAANRWTRLPHPVGRDLGAHHETPWPDGPPALDEVGRAALLDLDRRTATSVQPQSAPARRALLLVAAVLMTGAIRLIRSGSAR